MVSGQVIHLYAMAAMNVLINQKSQEIPDNLRFPSELISIYRVKSDETLLAVILTTPLSFSSLSREHSTKVPSKPSQVCSEEQLLNTHFRVVKESEPLQGLPTYLTLPLHLYVLDVSGFNNFRRFLRMQT